MAVRKKEMPGATVQEKPLQDASVKKKELPAVGNPENTVIVGGKLIEIKPTRLIYQRNRTASFYKILDMYPLPDIMAMDAGAFGDDRDGDKAVMDWLIAVFDDEEIVTANYDRFDTEMVEKLLSIFRRMNRIDEKEAKQKNLEMGRKGA